tara:strand:- start:950 stop:1750 length:801 start_codon:yes stop_codon:yes gene_type:complete
MTATSNNLQVKNTQVGPTIVTENLLDIWDVSSVHSYPRTGTTLYGLVKRNKNDGSMVNMASSNFIDEAVGVFAFDGTDEYISIVDNDSIDVGSDSFSVMLWIKPDQDGFDGPGSASFILVNKRGDGTFGSNAGWQVRINGSKSDGYWRLYNTGIDDASGSYFMKVSTRHYNFGWNHIALTYDADTGFDLYVNGNRESGMTIGAGTYGSLSNNIPLEIGGTKYINGSVTTARSLFEGSIALVHLYNKYLSREQVQQNFMASRGRFGL